MGIRLKVVYKAEEELFYVQAENGEQWRDLMGLTEDQALVLSYELQDAVTAVMALRNAKLPTKRYEPRMSEH